MLEKSSLRRLIVIYIITKITMNTDLMFSSATDNWATPQDFFDKLNEKYNFNLDPCCDSLNCKCEIWFYHDMWLNWLEERWTILENNKFDHCFEYIELRENQKTKVFCNPPYWKVLKDWVKKASEEIKKEYCKTIVMLIPARTDTRYFHEYIYKKENVEIEFIKGRLKFWDSKNSAPFPSMLVIFKNNN